jgi:hypothetical protein
MKRVYFASFLIYIIWSAFLVALLASTPVTLMYITPKFSGIDINNLMEASLLVLLLSVLNPVKLDNPFYLFFIGANFFIVIPLITFRFCTSQYDTELIDQTLSVILLGLFLSRTIALLPYLTTSTEYSPRSEFIEQKLRVISNIFAIISVVVIAISALSFGIASLKLDYQTIYIQRLNLRNIVKEGSFLGYALNNVEQLLLPSLFVFGLYLKNWKVVFVSVSATFVYVSFSGSRSTIAMLVLMTVIYLFHGNVFNVKIIKSILVMTFSLFCTLTYVFRNTETGNIVYDLFLRTVVVPGVGSIKYVEFFNSFGTTDFKQSRIIAHLFNESPIPVTYILGKLFFNNSLQNFSSNIWCDALISAGILGVILVSISLGLVLLIIRILLTNQPKVLVYPIYGYVTLNFVEQSFLTAFLSSGFALSILLAYYLRTQRTRVDKSM